MTDADFFIGLPPRVSSPNHALCTRFGFKWPLLVLTAVLALTVACSTLTPTPTPIPPPVQEIVGHTWHKADAGFLTWELEVECTIRNNGGSGNIEVAVTYDSSGAYWKKRAKVVTEFPEVTGGILFSPSGNYACTAKGLSD